MTLPQPLSRCARVADAATQPRCQSGWGSHSGTQPLCRSGWRSSHSATQSLCQSGWSSHSATQSLRVAEWLRQRLCQSGWVADVKISAIARSIYCKYLVYFDISWILITMAAPGNRGTGNLFPVTFFTSYLTFENWSWSYTNTPTL